MIALVRRVAIVVGYLVLVSVFALGGAGIVAVWSHPPGTSARAELTWRGDETLKPALDGASASLGSIGADVDHLALLARGTLASLTAADGPALTNALTEGQAAAVTIRDAAAALRTTVQTLPGDDPAHALLYSDESRARRAAILAAIDVTEGLGRPWALLTSGALQASRLMDLLNRHDATVAAAAAQGRSTDYPGALSTLATATALLDSAMPIRDQLANAADVSTLDDWVQRNRRYDDALAGLYTALGEAKGKITDAVRAAYAEEGIARSQLPPDPRALTVIIAEIGRGGLNQAVIEIEQARSRIVFDLQALTSWTGPSVRFADRLPPVAGIVARPRTPRPAGAVPARTSA
jgi:hypothetical protein